AMGRPFMSLPFCGPGASAALHTFPTRRSSDLRAQGDELGISWVWEIKSVNGKSLDLRLRLAPGFDSLEPQLRALVAQRFRRGSLYRKSTRLNSSHSQSSYSLYCV